MKGKKLEMLQGDLPLKAQRLVIEWLGYHKEELKIMWESQKQVNYHHYCDREEIFVIPKIKQIVELEDYVPKVFFEDGVIVFMM